MGGASRGTLVQRPTYGQLHVPNHVLHHGDKTANHSVRSGTVWYVGRDGTQWDEAFRPTFGVPKNRGTGCPMGRNLVDFSFHLSPLERSVPHPWNTNL